MICWTSKYMVGSDSRMSPDRVCAMQLSVFLFIISLAVARVLE